MPRPTGTFVVMCTTAKCKGRIVAALGKKGVCKRCGKRITFTKKYLRSLGKDV